MPVDRSLWFEGVGMEPVCWMEGPGLRTCRQDAREHLAKRNSESLPSVLVFPSPLIPFKTKPPILLFVFQKEQTLVASCSWGKVSEYRFTTNRLRVLMESTVTDIALSKYSSLLNCTRA